MSNITKMIFILLSIALVTIITIEGVWTYQVGKFNHMSQDDIRQAFNDHINNIKNGESLADQCDDARQALRIIEKVENKNRTEWQAQNTLEVAVKSAQWSRECN